MWNCFSWSPISEADRNHWHLKYNFLLCFNAYFVHKFDNGFFFKDITYSATSCWLSKNVILLLWDSGKVRVPLLIAGHCWNFRAQHRQEQYHNYASAGEEPLTFFFLDKKNKRNNGNFLSGPNKLVRTDLICCKFPASLAVAEMVLL